ncbi:hypothetical protein CH333_05525 [candidate division WOR-3 bacterium JGI_Cruoil_03_44_89]|uniref:Secretion system C-terminal sorting domain-containing protein n=1 Tax=candidate division WOR-3 bacterium JGI_Cruoil_03_44_89 TaxID=1973748 RepID=A0A235BSN3_UNCW3|nr:MAG: hypothetical protein CH333_05525 [candidate division WOR-3 bacterium JGI_Cruoil_03_44_89]
MKKIVLGVILLFTSSSLIGGDIPIFVAPEHQVAPSVAFSGNNYLVVWEDRREGYGIGCQIVSKEGTLIGDNFYISTGGRFPEVEWGDRNYLVAWGRYGQLISEDGTSIGGSFCIIPENDTLGFCGIKDIAWNGENYLIVAQVFIEDSSCPRQDILARFVLPDGGLGDSIIVVARADSAFFYGAPRVASDGEDFLVVWADWYGRIWGQRLSYGGTLLDSSFRIGFTWQQSPDVTWNGTNYLVVWDDGRGGGGYEWDIYGQLISQDGTLVGEEIPISTYTSDQRFCAVASNRMNHIVIWLDWRVYIAVIYGQFVSLSGSLIGANLRVQAEDPLSFYGDASPGICYGNENYFVVWSDQRLTSPDTSLDIYGNFIPFTGIETDDTSLLSDIHLFQNKPNPFKNIKNTEVSYFLPRNSKVAFSIFNLGGQVVFRTNLGHKSAGFHTLTIDGDKLGSQGVYFYRIEADGYAITKKMVMMGK